MPDNDKSLLERVRFGLAFSVWWGWRLLTLKDVRTAESFDELSDLGKIRGTLLPFDGQRWYHQLLVFAIGIGIWIGTYAGIMHGMGWVEYATLDTTQAMQHRRYAGTVALAVATTYYTLLWTQAYGGWATNVLLYPVFTIALMPRPVLGLFMGAPERRFSPGGITGAPVQWSFDVLTVLILGYGLPFFVIGVTMMFYWANAGERGRRHQVEWHREFPDVVLRGELSGDWEDLDEDLREVYLEAGYEPDTEPEEADSLSGESLHSEGSPKHVDEER